MESSFSIDEHEDVIDTLIRTPPLELKTLPSELKHVHLNVDSSQPIIISPSLIAEQEHQLIDVIQTHCSAIGYNFDDIKGIGP